MVQAKFRQRPQGTGQDGTWALAELRKELEKFVSAERGLRKPEYYLFATNVVLSPTADKGAKDKAAALIKKYQKRLGLKGYRIWDHDQICTLLDTHESVRTAYTAWITPGDVLAVVLQQMRPRQPDFRSLMVSFVQKDLQAEQHVNLGQAGHNAQERIPLARVFVDLPVGEPDQDVDALTRPAKDESDPFQDSKVADKGAIEELLELSARRLDPASYPVSPRGEARVGSLVPGRVVFIGGPGQGKSTLTQFYCQMHRVALLEADPAFRPLPEVAEAIRTIREQCTCESLALPDQSRFPLRVELNRFASALARNETTSLFDYLLGRVKQRSERDLGRDDLRAWLAAYPWLLALDGLDEVPATSNRSQVLAAIQDFLVDAHGCNADLLLISTSRPQGYNDDFSPRYYRHRQLLSLDVPRALHYAARLIDQRWCGDEDRKQLLLDRLQRAGAEDATARLMRSPLQVTIMALLVESQGEPPKERWRLFNEYYQVINRREKERQIPAAKLLNTYQADIDAIHQRVGLRLQRESEHDGSTEALLSKIEFAELVTQRLCEEGHTGADLDQLRTGIVSAAVDRLVFLVAPREDVIGFEIRSLQEFMAAQCLMNGSDLEVSKRLRAIAHAAHWRNVFLFAAGRCFHDKQHLRDTLYTLCCELNEGEGVNDGGELERAALAGSLLALDILEDGAVANQPKHLGLYLRLALRVLELPPCPAQVRVARLYHPEFVDLYRKEIEAWLSDGQEQRRFGAWRVLLQLINQNVDWAMGLAECHWPGRPESAQEIFATLRDMDIGDWLAERWGNAVMLMSPASLGDEMLYEGHAQQDKLWSMLPTGLSDLLVIQIGEPQHSLGVYVVDVGEGFELRPSMLGAREYIVEIDLIHDVHPLWRWLQNAVNFGGNPSKDLLAKLLVELANKCDDNIVTGRDRWKWSLKWGLAWPLRSCIADVFETEGWERVFCAVTKGEFGDENDWWQAERRWIKKGLTAVDIHYIPQNGLSFDDKVAVCGYPFINPGMQWSHTSSLPSMALAIKDIWRSLPRGYAKQYLARSVLYMLSSIGDYGSMVGLDVALCIPMLLNDSQGEAGYLEIINGLSVDFWEDSRAIDVIDRLGEGGVRPCFAGYYDFDDRRDNACRLEIFLAQNPNRSGILNLLSVSCQLGYNIQQLSVPLNPDAYTTSRSRAAAVVVRLAQSNLSEADATRLANTLLNALADGEDRISDSLVVLGREENSGHAGDVFLTTLHAGLPVQAWKSRREVLQAIQDRQRQHLANASHLG